MAGDVYAQTHPETNKAANSSCSICDSRIKHYPVGHREHTKHSEVAESKCHTPYKHPADQGERKLRDRDP